MPTLKDVAREAGLTVTTVSRVLNNRGYISADARSRVEEAIKKLNYHPNEVARSLHNKTSNTIGLIVPHIRHPYFAEMISNIENAAFKQGYKVLLCSSHAREDRAKEYVDICTRNRVAGIILCSGAIPVEIFEGLSVPVITVERYLDNGTASVECDNKHGGELAALRLIDSGCRNLLFIGSTKDIELPADLRGIGFKEVCEKHAVRYIEVDPERNLYSDMSYQEFIEEILKQYPDVDGLFASSDVIAAQALQVCRKLGISVPGELKIIGFDDVIIASLTSPQLTTIHQPVKEMAEAAVNLLVDVIAGKKIEQKTILPVNLVERETT